jgi:hypothetical protein
MTSASCHSHNSVGPAGDTASAGARRAGTSRANRRRVRLVILLACVSINCDAYDSGAIMVDPADGVLGLDLTQHYSVTQQLCDNGYDSDGCTDVTPMHLDVTLDDSNIVELGRVDANAFDLKGTGTGTSTIQVTGDDDISQTLSVAVVGVDVTTLFAQRTPPEGGLGLPDVQGPLQVFGGTELAIGQTSVAADHSALVGAATLLLDPGPTNLAPESECTCYMIRCDCYSTGAVLGAAKLTAPRGALDVDIVDASAIASFTVDDSSSITVEVEQGAEPNQLFLTPSDASHHPIVGRGPMPTLTIDDPTIASASFDETVTVGRALFVRGLSIGSTSVHLTWGTAQLELAVSVVP